MEVNVRYFYPLRDLTGIPGEKVRVDEGWTVGDLIGDLAERYGEDFKRYIYSGLKRKGLKVIFLMDGKNVLQLQGLATKLVDSCTVTMMPPVAGG